MSGQEGGTNPTSDSDQSRKRKRTRKKGLVSRTSTAPPTRNGDAGGAGAEPAGCVASFATEWGCCEHVSEGRGCSRHDGRGLGGFGLLRESGHPPHPPAPLAPAPAQPSSTTRRTSTRKRCSSRPSGCWTGTRRRSSAASRRGCVPARATRPTFAAPPHTPRGRRSAQPRRFLWMAPPPSCLLAACTLSPTRSSPAQVQQERSRLTQLNDRIQVVRKKVERLSQGTRRATTIYAPSKYPVPESAFRGPPTARRFATTACHSPSHPASFFSFSSSSSSQRPCCTTRCTKACRCPWVRPTWVRCRARPRRALVRRRRSR